MLFVVAETASAAPLALQGRYQAILRDDRWDDWGEYRTQFRLVVFDPLGQRHDIGDVKIAHAGLLPARTISPGHRAPFMMREPFAELPVGYFSLGQGESYYEALNGLPENIRESILTSLRDVAYDLDLFALYREQHVMGQSLLRFVSQDSVTGKLHRLAHGDATPTAFSFDFRFYGPDGLLSGPHLEFRVQPGRQPPTNVHVLIGRNGAGKTRFLQGLANCIVRPEEPSKVGQIQLLAAPDGGWAFASLIYVSFSAFDDYQLPKPAQSTMKAAQVSLAGEAAFTDKGGRATKAGAAIFTKSFEKCRIGAKRRRWLEAISALENDPLFEETRVRELADLSDIQWRDEAEHFFTKLSSGHAVVLLTITRLVELVDERTLVLIDEPEGHLHPPLLSALVRSLSDLLTRRNAVAIIATHSPVVLQEAPKGCVWLLRRSGAVAVAERPMFETFGENVGSLTREVFGLEVTTAGFHKLVNDAVGTYDGSYEAVLAHFNQQLGVEARAIARGLCALHSTNDLPS